MSGGAVVVSSSPSQRLACRQSASAWFSSAELSCPRRRAQGLVEGRRGQRRAGRPCLPLDDLADQLLHEVRVFPRQQRAVAQHDEEIIPVCRHPLFHGGHEVLQPQQAELQGQRGNQQGPFEGFFGHGGTVEAPDVEATRLGP